METVFFFFSFSIPPFADDSGDEEPASQSDKSELHGTLKTLSSKLEDLSTCNDLIAKHGAALQRSLSELENLKLPAESGEKIKAVNERATLFRITSNAMINVSAAVFASRQGEAFSPPPPLLPLPFLSCTGAEPLQTAPRAWQSRGLGCWGLFGHRWLQLAGWHGDSESAAGSEPSPAVACAGFPPAFGWLLVGRGARGAASVGAKQLLGAPASLGRGGESKRT